MAETEMASEVASQLDLSIIRYSQVWEDHLLLVKGLEISSGDNLLVITSAGDNVLNLLLEKPTQITAIDISPAQNSLLEIKLAAIKCLEYEEYLQLLGLASVEDRVQLYNKLKPLLPQHVRDYWSTNMSAITGGLTVGGRLEKYITQFSEHYLPPLVTAEEVDALFNSSSLEEQRELFNKLPLDDLERTFKSFSSVKQQKNVGRSAAQMKYVSKTNEEVTSGLWERFCQICRTQHLKDNYFMSWYLRGHRGYDPASKPEFAPPYLRRENFNQLKGLVERVSVVTRSVEDFLSETVPMINKAVLSDMFEYMSPEDCDRLFKIITKSMSIGGRVAYWILYNDRYPSTKQLVCLEELSETLHKEDRVFFYGDFKIIEIL